MGTEIGREWSVVIGAPILTALTVLAVIAVVWGAMYFLYRHRNEALNEYLRREQAETVRLRGRLAEYEKSGPTPIAEEPAAAAALEAANSPTSQELGRLAHRTLQLARHARASGATIRDIQIEFPKVLAVLVTLRKERGIRSPKQTGRTHIDLEAACRMLEGVGPFLRQGHDDEARRFAEAFATDFDANAETRLPPPA